MTSIMHATFEALVLYHSLSRPNQRGSWQYGRHCNKLARTIVYKIPRPSLLLLFATVLVLFFQTLGYSIFSCFCLLPVNIRKRLPHLTSNVRLAMVHIRAQIAVWSLFSLHSTFRVLLLQQNISTEEQNTIVSRLTDSRPLTRKTSARSTGPPLQRCHRTTQTPITIPMALAVPQGDLTHPINKN